MKRIVLLLLLPMLGHAEPGPATQYLINERASLLDIGMMRLETLTAEFRERVDLHWTDNGKMKRFRAEISPEYEPDDDKIYVYFSVMDSEPTEAQMAEGCKNAMGQMNVWLMKSLPGLFMHTAIDDPGKTPDLSKSLPGMFELRCYFSSSRDSSEGRFWASQTLGDPADRKMTIGRWKMRNE